jgi:hypothetical protein
MPSPDVFDVVQLDLQEGLKGVFDAASDAFVRVDSTEPVPTGTTAVAWRYQTVHAGEFLGLAATGQAVLIEGVTLAAYPDDTTGWQLTRYIDWLSVAAQLGLTLSGRPVSMSLPVELVSQSGTLTVSEPKSPAS